MKLRCLPTRKWLGEMDLQDDGQQNVEGAKRTDGMMR